MKALKATVRRVFVWGVAVALVFTAVYALGGRGFLSLLTDEQGVVEAAVDYLPWAVAVPLAGVAAFLWDGIFVGVTATRGMLLSSVAATVVFFGLLALSSSSLGNHALWMAFVAYLLARSVVQTVLWKCSSVKR